MKLRHTHRTCVRHGTDIIMCNIYEVTEDGALVGQAARIPIGGGYYMIDDYARTTEEIKIDDKKD